MQVTYLIGNGFDVNLGLKTKYSDFYKVYLEDEHRLDSNNSVSRFCNFLKSDINSGDDTKIKYWSDFEMAYANFDFVSEQETRDVIVDFSTALNIYLKNQVYKCDYSMFRDKSIFYNFLNSWFKEPHVKKLPETKDLVEKIYSRYQNENVIFNFITLNYTNSLEKIIENDLISNLKFNTFKSANGKIYTHEVGNILHLHGRVDDYIIIGIDSLEQFTNKALHTSSMLSNYCIKHDVNMSNGNSSVEENYVSLISKSDVICTYGLSFGDTDERIWLNLNIWLRDNPDHRLIVFDFDFDTYQYDQIIRQILIEYTLERKRNFLAKLKFDTNNRFHTNLIDDYLNQIYVVDSKLFLRDLLVYNDSSETKELQKT